MPWDPAVTDIEKLQDRPELARLLEWNREAVEGAKFDRNELSITVRREKIREACAILRDTPQLRFNFLSDLAAADYYPIEPRFEIVYHLLSIPRKQRVRLKVKLAGSDARIESVTSVWPAANYYEREIFDLFGVHFDGHPYLRRLLMPDDWQGHPLRKDYPVEGYR
jgi:NADH-quinone oxidoreductase subunit C